MGEKDK